MNIFRNTDIVHLKNLIKGIFELSITMLSAQSSKCCLETVGVRMKIQLFVMGDFTTLYNVCAVPWRMLSTVGVFSTVGDIMSTVGGYLEYRGVFSTVGDIMINVGGYL